MLTEAYTTIVDGQWYIRRDFDSAFYRIGKVDYDREDATGVPAYVGFQLEIEQPQTRAEIARQLEGYINEPWFTWEFVEKFARLAFRYLPKSKRAEKLITQGV